MATKNEKLVEKEVTYTLFIEDKFFIVNNVPARVNIDTGEQYFSPQTVDKLHKIIMGDREPVRMVQTPVFDYSG